MNAAILLILIVALIALVFGRQGVARWMRRLPARLSVRSRGRAALARQPDQIHLVPGHTGAFHDSQEVERIAQALVGQGFEEAGIYRVRGMPVVIRLLAQPDEGFYATVYEHATAGVWFDIVSRYADGESVTFASSHETGLAQRPGHPTVHVPGECPLALLGHARVGRPQHPLRPATVAGAALAFEEGYADAIAWRKRKGLSARELEELTRRTAA